MSLAFFVCGLQLVFLTTHLPSYLTLCGMDPMLGAEALAVIGLFNVIGSWGFGWLGDRYSKRTLLGSIYIVRSLAMAVYFLMPVSPASTLTFAAVMGLTWLGVIPLVNGLVVQMFGIKFLSTLTGIAFLSHQVGSFLGAWGGGAIYDALGSYDRALQTGVIVGLIAGSPSSWPTIGRRVASPPIIHRPNQPRSHARHGEMPVNPAGLAACALQRTVTGLTN
jgi:predicted MFS family arabinose efflux permease